MINSISTWLINCKTIIVCYLQLSALIAFIETLEQTKKQQTKSTYNTETYKPNNLLSKGTCIYLNDTQTIISSLILDKYLHTNKQTAESTWISQTATKCDSSDNCTIVTTNSICFNGTCKCDDSFIANIVNKTCVHQSK